MKYLIYFLLIVLIGSCSKSTDPDKIIGKWWLVDIEEKFGYRDVEYVEAHFKDGEAYFLAFQAFEKFYQRFRIDSDSIYYYDYNYSLGYEIVNDTTLRLYGSEKAWSFYKLDDSVVTYDEVNMSDSTLKNDFIWDVKARAMEAMKKYEKK